MERTGIILLNGEPYNDTIKRNDGDIVVCCDGAYNWASGKVGIDVILGDFDSLDFIPEGAIVYPAEKDSTDAELAVEYLSGKCRQIVVYGGGGKREDHFLGNLCVLYLALKKGMAAKMVNNKSVVYIAQNKFYGQGAAENIVSVVPFSDLLHINESTGFKYSLKGLTLNRHSTRGISNVLTADNFFVDIAEGTALIIVNKEL